MQPVRSSSDVRPTGRVRVLAVPAGHNYPQRLRGQALAGRSAGLGPGIEHLDDPPVPGAPAGQWWPPPALDPDWVEAHADEVDVVHLHFGFDASTPAELSRWTAALDAAGIPLVLTVHDIVNPHFVDQAEHLARLDVLVAGASALVTLTPGAARWIRERWHREAAVVAHPHVAPLPLVGRRRAPAAGRFVAGLHLKSLRTNVEAEPVIDALVSAVAPLPGAELVVSVHREVLASDHGRGRDLRRALERFERAGALRVDPHHRHDDDALWSYLQGLDLSVMPYAFGTHSGWVEACRDLGTPVLAPRTGLWVEQQPVWSFGWPSGQGPDRGEIARAVRQVHRDRPRWQASRAQRSEQQRRAAAWHEQLYLALSSGAHARVSA